MKQARWLPVCLGLLVAAMVSVAASHLWLPSQSPACATDVNGQRLPNQWCDGDVFFGQGHLEYEQLVDSNGVPLVNPWDGQPTMGYVIHDGGKYLPADSEGQIQSDPIDDGGGGLTASCTVNSQSGELWTAGERTNRIARVAPPSGATGPQLIAAIDVSPYTATAACGSDPGNPGAGCGTATSLVFDRDGNLYVGTENGTNRILKLSQAGALLDSYDVPLGPRGPARIDLAADQKTMFYTSGDGLVRVFRVDRTPLQAALFTAGVQPLADAVRDPGDLHLFGQIVVKDGGGQPLGAQEVKRVRVLPPGDGSGGLLVLVGGAYSVDWIHLDGARFAGVGQDYMPETFRDFGLTPDAQSVWVTATSQATRVHVPSNFAEVEPFTGPWSAVQSLCVKGGYTAAVSQPDCSANPADPLCHPLPWCSVPDPSTPGCQPAGAPTIDAVANQENFEGDTIASITLTGHDPHGSPLTYSAFNLPLGLVFNPDTHTISGTIDWRAGDAVGFQPVQAGIRVTNARGLTDTKRFFWTIDFRDAPPSMAVTPTPTRDATGAYRLITPRGVPIDPLTLIGTDADGCDGVPFLLPSGETLPDGLTLTPESVSNPNCTAYFPHPAAISGTPTTAGTTTFHLQASATHPLGTFIWMVTGDPIAAPVFSLGSGSYASGTVITISTLVPDATITYTLDGSEPLESSPTIASGDSLLVGPYTLKAKAWRTGDAPSAVTSATYTVADDAIPMVTGGNSSSTSIAVRADGTAWAWGRNQFGAVGDGTTAMRFDPTAVSGGLTMRAVSTGQRSSLGLMRDGTVRGWGRNSAGEVGDGTTEQRSTPTLVPGLSDIVAIDSGNYHSVALRATGEVVAWGLNDVGQLGDGTTTNRLSPITVAGLTNVKAISAGGGHTLALKTDGTVWAWGFNFVGELGDGTREMRTSPVQVAGLTSVVAIATAWESSYALTSDGSVWGWGRNDLGELGDGTNFLRETPVAMVGISDAVGVAAGFQHAFVLKADGTVWAVGDNAFGQLGSITTPQEYTFVPQPIPGLSSIARVGAGDYTGYAVAADGSAWAWGINAFGVIGDGTQTARHTPVAIAGPGLNWRPWIPVIATLSGTYPVEQNPLIANGDASAVMHYTVSGLDPTEADPTIAADSTVPVGQSLTLKVRSFKAGAPPSEIASAAYVLKVVAPTFSPPGGVYSSAQSVTLSTTTASATIRFTTDGGEVTAESAVSSGAIVIDSPTSIRAVAAREGWTSSDEGSAAYLVPPPAVAPPAISPAAGTYPNERVIAFTAAAGASVRYTLDGTDPTEQSPLFVRGVVLERSATVKARAFKARFLPSSVTTAAFAILAPNTTGAPSISLRSGRFTTEQVITIAGPAAATLRYTTNGTDPTESSTAIASGGTITVGRAMAVKVRAWQSGLAPSVVSREDYVITGAIAAGDRFSMVLKADRTVWTWGANYTGQLGDGTQDSRIDLPSSPVLTGVIAIAAGYGHALALKADGTVWGWGSNEFGQLGGTPFNNRLSPQQVSGLGDVMAIAASDRSSYALKSDGTVWAWGANQDGQLGDGTFAPTSEPTLVPGLAGVTSIAAGSNFVVAVVSYGAGVGQVWAWGANYSGQLGDGTTVTRPMPQAVFGTTLVKAVSAGGGRAGARSSADELLLWGSGDYGQQANGGFTYAQDDFNNYVPARPVPWVTPLAQISGGVNHALALDRMGRVWGWGANSYCQLAEPCVESQVSAELISGLTNGAMLAGGYYHSLAVTQDGQLWVWGANFAGQLGTGDTTQRNTPYATGLTLADYSWLAGDPDNDGLTTWREYEVGTDPLSADTDGDGIPDPADLASGESSTDFDPDGDGLTNAREALLGTNPNVADTDGDGHADGADVDPLDPTRWELPPADPNDHTPPVITLTSPSGARPVGGGGL